MAYALYATAQNATQTVATTLQSDAIPGVCHTPLRRCVCVFRRASFPLLHGRGRGVPGTTYNKQQKKKKKKETKKKPKTDPKTVKTHPVHSSSPPPLRRCKSLIVRCVRHKYHIFCCQLNPCCLLWDTAPILCKMAVPCPKSLRAGNLRVKLNCYVSCLLCHLRQNLSVMSRFVPSGIMR